MPESRQSEATAQIRLMGQEMESHEVPISILVPTLAGFQQIIYLLATAQEKRTIGQRFRVSQEIQQRYSLRCQIPQPGSYAIPLVLKPIMESQLSMFGNYEKVMENLDSFFSSLSQDSFDPIQNIFPDSKLRNRALREVRKLLPKAGENWKLGFSRQGDQEHTVSHETATYIDRWLTQDTPEDAVMTVTGELIRIDFDKRTVVLRYPPTHQEIECIYIEDLEDSLIDNRRQMIQVTGKFTLGGGGHPTKLTDVTNIEPVDLSPISITRVFLEAEGKELIFRQPLRLTPSMDEETSQLFIVEDAEINLYAFAYNRDELIYEINEQITMMWEEYVEADPQDLASDARQLREKLLEKIQEG
ncbi:MAG: hypothetical protein SAJ37_15480 [Oscillatoria sp. PMC 1068.18]|nr:hypothetical protein [Oscillatoria sp. PMC 1068.18]